MEEEPEELSGPPMDIPRVRPFPSHAAQCDRCGGHGTVLQTGFDCPGCGGRGWVAQSSPQARRCEREGCGKPIPPDQVAVYCGNECAREDA